MHTTRVEVEGRGYYALHNGDYSGDVEVYMVLTQKERESAAAKNCKTHDPKICELPFEVMKALVGEYLKDAAVDAIEDMTGSEMVEALASR